MEEVVQKQAEAIDIEAKVARELEVAKLQRVYSRLADCSQDFNHAVVYAMHKQATEILKKLR